MDNQRELLAQVTALFLQFLIYINKYVISDQLLRHIQTVLSTICLINLIYFSVCFQVNLNFSIKTINFYGAERIFFSNKKTQLICSDN